MKNLDIKYLVGGIACSLLGFGMMKGTAQIVEWSVRDESLHSQAGCWLFRTLLQEQPHLDTNSMRDKVIEACHLSVQLEFDFIDKAFEMGNIEGLTKEQLKNYIKARANEKMVELGYKAIYNDIDPNLLKQIEWLDFRVPSFTPYSYPHSSTYFCLLSHLYLIGFNLRIKLSPKLVMGSIFVLSLQSDALVQALQTQLQILF